MMCKTCGDPVLTVAFERIVTCSGCGKESRDRLEVPPALTRILRKAPRRPA